MGKPDTKNMSKQRTLREKMNRLNAAYRYTAITDNDDPRIALTREVNASFAALSAEEQQALLDEWGY